MAVAVAIIVVICVSVAMVVAVSVPMSVAVAMTVTTPWPLRVKTDKKSAEEATSSVLYGVFALSAVKSCRIFRKTFCDTPAFQESYY